MILVECNMARSVLLWNWALFGRDCAV